MTPTFIQRLVALLLPCAGAFAQDAELPGKSLGIVTITGSQPTSLPSQIPTTTESITRADIQRRINATDSEDALKYFPSLLVRKRYIGDYNHAVLSSRASGTGNSARSAVYTDGILLSNYLGNGVGGLSFPPRWGLVTPEEIERVDVMYGPFSAAYPGNSVGAVVDYVTRLPERFEVHAGLGYVAQPFELYGTDRTFRARQTHVSLGNRAGAWAWWINLNQTGSQSQPLTFATRLASAGVPGASGTPVTGAVPGHSATGQPWLILGAGTQYDTRQDHLKIKLVHELTSTLRASYVFGLWRNVSEGQSESFLRDANGQPVFSGPIHIDGNDYPALTGADFALTRERQLHTMHGLSVKSRTRGPWDWEAAASWYDYERDHKRQNSAANVQPAAQAGGPGTLAAGDGTGWHNAALKGIWRPEGAGGAHVVDVGYQLDCYRLRYRSSVLAGNFRVDAPGALASAVQGESRMQSLYAQDAWRLSQHVKTVLGLRAEVWEAFDGRTDFSATGSLAHAGRSETFLSPKAALAWLWRSDTVLKASVGRAVRMPTVAELYGATSTANSQFINDPDLKPERSWTGELSAEKTFDAGSARLTWFAEQTRDALYSQTTFDAGANRNISRVQNVGRIATSGLEAAATSGGWLLEGLDLSGSLTYADSTIEENTGFVATPGDTTGKRQPNIPRWRATALASYRFDPRWTGTLALRHSGGQYRTLNNADVNGHAYMGVSRFTTLDARLHGRIDRQWSLALGVDNLNNDAYWNFHPYPQRSYSAELRFDL